MRDAVDETIGETEGLEQEQPGPVRGHASSRAAGGVGRRALTWIVDKPGATAPGSVTLSAALCADQATARRVCQEPPTGEP
ncbi:hypothetical protein OG948_02550 [Embleya sp. NBC_00888]|uniref:hypothetical protein n=1 Tax=Embleya sp. NBC_00888 TaxID=2975960 RepID=UPI0038691370|nr:hypothetical protein OG948_02550 [Embleya sp. NBC_00888]